MDRVMRFGSSEPIDDELVEFFREVPCVVLFSNLRWDAKHLWPRGLVATFTHDQPFVRDPFVDGNYAFGCSIFQIKTVSPVPYPPTERIHAFTDALRTIDESALNRGGRVGLYIEKGVNYVVVYAGLNKTDADAFETEMAESQTKTTETKRHVARLATQSKVDVQALMISKAKVSMASRKHMFLEYAARASANRDTIARAFVERIKTTIESKCKEVVWNVCVGDRAMSWYSDCAPPPTDSNALIPYGSPLEVVVMQRVTAGRLDVSQQAIPCVWRPGEPLENDSRIVGPNVAFKPTDLKPFQHYDITEMMRLQAIVVRCAVDPYDADPTNEIEKEFGRV